MNIPGYLESESFHVICFTFTWFLFSFFIRSSLTAVFDRRLCAPASITSSPLALTLYMLGNFSCFCRRVLIFFKNNLFKKLFQEHYLSVKWFGLSNSLDPDQDDILDGIPNINF